MFDDPDEHGMKTKLGVVLAPGLTFAHEYDFGSTTYLKLEVAGEREGRIGPDPLRLLARNDAPKWEWNVRCAAQLPRSWAPKRCGRRATPSTASFTPKERNGPFCQW